MKISTKGDYGVRALVELAHHYGQGPLQSAEIAARQGIPEPYLDQLLTTLRRARFIRSVRGPKGGHALIREPSELKLSEVVVALEGSLSPISCLDDPEGCGKQVCVQREVWEMIRDATTNILEGITIGDLAAKERQYKHNGGRYDI
ncbi:MAG: Rrf2 family transcriptional regulator [Dehalococcoidia bacterium]